MQNIKSFIEVISKFSSVNRKLHQVIVAMHQLEKRDKSGSKYYFFIAEINKNLTNI